ncbi:MAG TPA: Dam family site-specific DNA-(adenine-N6)-methyltransferase [Thermoanaerobaculia bacterium]|nr:Dam family site-specific DNA-(adenine-N6)-methyltransferase [Thermoanaerobaculia bacterium]
MTPKPFVKAAGGKTKLLPEILPRVPDFPGTYHEPFVGGGAVFLALAPKLLAKIAKAGRVPGDTDPVGWAVLNDANAELANAYVVVRDAGDKLEERLHELKKSYSEAFFYKTREQEPEGALERAARFVFLNKTCFNGLWRVNAKGKFNVPFGKYKDPKVAEPGVIAHWSKILRGVDIHASDFEPRIDAAKAGDFIYVDPPYLPRSKTASFERYTAGGFKVKEHERLAASLSSAHKRGVKFTASQGDSETIRALYKEFEIIAVSVTHSIAAKKSSRIKVGEVLIRNYA